METQALQLENTATIQLQLVVASASDLKEIDFYKELPQEDFEPVYKRRMHLPYWLQSFKTNKIESRCYFIHEDTNMQELKLFLDAGRVFIHKDFKKEN